MKHARFVNLFLCLTAALPLIAARAAHAQTENVLYTFTGGSDGFSPFAGLTSEGGNFYGTTQYGGLAGFYSGNGTVFELSPNGGGGWNETVLYSFCSALNCADGNNPYSTLIFDKGGNLYGTTWIGGASNSGVVFELSPAGGSWTETVLYSFAGGLNANPASGLIADTAGNLFGTLTGGSGTVFELSPSGSKWTEQVIYAPNNIGYTGLTMDAAGNIFGTAGETVFELSPNGSGGWNPTVIHTFTGAPKDGSSPNGTPVLDKAGNIYGTTQTGGAKGYGTVYKLTPVTKGKKKGTWTEKILYSFKGGKKKDGGNPWAGVVLDAAGNIYGTTLLGNGTVFELVAPVGKGVYTEKILWSFNGTNGTGPYDSPILDTAGNLYGTTAGGGVYGSGVVFEVTP
jgi:uncharacterized repeat protein (TIGR03803 family)